MSILGTVGIADKGDYNASTTYVEGNSVYYGGSTWVALKNNITGITPEEGENWKYLARGFGSDSLSQIEGTDTNGVMGTAGAVVVSQDLVDAITARVMTQLIPYANIVNNFMATDPNTVLSGPMGKSLKDQLDQTNSNLTVASGEIDITGNDLSAGIIYYQNVGKKSVLSFGGLQLKNSLQSGTTINLITLNSGSRPLVVTKSVLVCQNIPLYLTIATTGEIILGNYSGIAVPVGAIVEGQVSYVIS